jgi:hypothetical protein
MIFLTLSFALIFSGLSFGNTTSELLLRKTSEIYSNDTNSDERVIFTKTCDFYNNVLIVTTAKGPSSQNVRLASYSSHAVKLLIRKAAQEYISTTITGSCSDSSIIVKAFNRGSEILLEEEIFCNSERIERTGTASTILRTFVNDLCPSL